MCDKNNNMGKILCLTSHHSVPVDCDTAPKRETPGPWGPGESLKRGYLAVTSPLTLATTPSKSVALT